MENIHHKFSEPHVTSSAVLLYLTNNLNPNNNQFTLIESKEKFSHWRN